MRPARASRGIEHARCLALVAALLLPFPAAAPAQVQGELPEQLRTIAEVQVRGMKKLPRRTLKQANLKTRRPSLLPWRDKPSLRLDYLRADTAAIASLYRHHGYLDARVHWVIEPTRDPSAARVVFTVTEGPLSRVATVELSGVTAFHEREVRRVLLARPRRAYDPAFLGIDTLQISRLYQERGYRPHTLASARRGEPDPTAIHVRYDVAEGPRYVIGSIDYEGTGRLREQLARRELLVRPGDFYRRSRLEESIQRLYDTGLYSQVQISTLVDTTVGQLDLLLRVAERRPRWVDLGIGSGSADLFRFEGAWGHRNLDSKGLLGSISGQLALDRQRTSVDDESQTLRLRHGRASAGLVEPWLLGLRLQGRSALFYEEDHDDRDARFLQHRDSRGVELGLLREFSRIFRGSLTGHTALVHQSYDVFLTVPGVPDSVQNEFRAALSDSLLGRYWDNGIALSLVRDTRDDRITTDRGSLQTAIAEMAGGPLRGASSYEKYQFSSSWYSPRANGWTMAVRVQGGVMGPIGDAQDDFAPGTEDERVRRVPKERRFFIGGVNSLRGWGENSVPGDGGLAMLLANVEARIPLWGPLGAEVFVDAGNVWARPEYIKVTNFTAPWLGYRAGPGEVRYSYGVGARLLLPFGPLRADLAWCDHPEFDPRRADIPVLGKQRFAFQFAIGPSF